MALLRATGITKTYYGQKALDRVSFDLEDGHILCLLGPSGCGKTTLLRIIAGLETPDSGQVLFAGEDMARLDPHLRRFGMMFQEYALFPHKDVRGNVSFGLRMQKLAPAEIARRTDEVLDLMGLKDFAHRNVSELSGGERSRVALARSLAPRPRLLLLDEPLAALDRALRERLMIDLKAILKNVGVTTIFVTHDQAEAFAVADVIAVIIEGRIVQIDSPERLYRNPANVTVARFLGLQNLIAGTFDSEGDVVTGIGVFHLVPPAPPRDDQVVLLIEPDAARILGPGERPGVNTLVVSGLVKNFLFRGKSYTLEMTLAAGTTLVFDLPDDAGPLAFNQEIRLAIDPAGVVVMGDTAGSAP
ncbi:MAG: ABC transporter ATP-binding protein [Syntrophaceae bacterium]|nr:ABC transporter ATP-binding protein [Deltaproteobacteria bacterium]